MSLLIGAIGDDMTGSTDLALMLAKQGMSVLQFIGLPAADAEIKNTQAAVVALKSRTIPADEAVSQSQKACDWLLKRGARQIFFKYCSTFDSTEAGNIGPVAETLLNQLQDGITVFCPAFPENGRTVYNGHLFVGLDLLSDSSMRDHPLTPMHDANLVRFLGKQVSSHQKVSLVPFTDVDRGPSAIKERLTILAGQGCRFAIVDAVCDRHLMDIGRACEDFKLVTGGSALAMGFAENIRLKGLLTGDGGLAKLEKLPGQTAVLAGSCSLATRRQVQQMAAEYPALAIDPLEFVDGSQNVNQIIDWAKEHVSHQSVLIYSTAQPMEVAAIQAKLGRERVSQLVEETLAAVAVGLRKAGVRKLIVAGGETSGAVLEALQVKTLRIGPEIAPGVPWTICDQEPGMYLALKSGNFGDEVFFQKAMEVLP